MDEGANQYGAAAVASEARLVDWRKVRRVAVGIGNVPLCVGRRGGTAVVYLCDMHLQMLSGFRCDGAARA
ncbi:hypothetical protein E3A20_05600 [Planctomyces bekefii]|uniref:Uncharacterized protein n=1 Tax=Planctomyces bekefii TaxID=1653850 RepID=A0A5C6MDR7_9PLAN|nr:hypothetical protein E3A20_05600 [Planctomyces bekefii]